MSDIFILVYNYGFVKNFYRLDKILSQARQNFVKGMINFYHRLDNSCCYLLFFLFGLSSCLRIRGYLIKYSRIFHYASMDISLRIRGYAKFLLCLRGLLVVCFGFFSYMFFLISRKMKCRAEHYALRLENEVSRPKGPKATHS